MWYLDNSGFIAATDFFVSVPIAEWQLGAARDLDRDGKTDLIWYGPNSGNVVRWHMNGVGVAPTVESLPSIGPGWHNVP